MSTQTITRPRRIRNRTRDALARYKINGLWHEHRLIGGKYKLFIKIGHKWRVCLNVELPVKQGQYIAHPLDGVCSECVAIYSELMRNAYQPCSECRVEAAAERAALLEDAGIPMGWGGMKATNTPALVNIGAMTTLNGTDAGYPRDIRRLDAQVVSTYETHCL